MYRRRQTVLNVEGLESKLVLSSIAPHVAVNHHAMIAVMTRLEGSLKGTYLTSHGIQANPIQSIQLSGGGLVTPLGTVSVEGTVTATGGQLTLHCSDKAMTETCILTTSHVVSNETGVVETFSYTTTDGVCAGTFVLDLHPQSTSPGMPSQIGSFDAQFC